MSIKTYTRRDSATAALRKLGIPKELYGDFIEVIDGAFHVDLARAQVYASGETVQAPKPAPKKAKPVKKKKPKSISAVAREAILEGLSNPQVFIRLQAVFGEERINEEHKHYPSWYRCELRRAGRLPEHLNRVEVPGELRADA